MNSFGGGGLLDLPGSLRRDSGVLKDDGIEAKSNNQGVLSSSEDAPGLVKSLHGSRSNPLNLAQDPASQGRSRRDLPNSRTAESFFRLFSSHTKDLENSTVGTEFVREESAPMRSSRFERSGFLDGLDGVVRRSPTFDQADLATRRMSLTPDNNEDGMNIRTTSMQVEEVKEDPEDKEVLPEFEKSLEAELQAVQATIAENRTRALGGLPMQILRKIDVIQKKQHSILTQHINLENSNPVGMMNRPTDQSTEEFQEIMQHREAEAHQMVEKLAGLESDIKALSRSIAESRISTEEVDWRPSSPVEISEDDDSSTAEFRSVGEFELEDS